MDILKTVCGEGPLALGGGYNSVEVAHALDAESGILTPTLTDAAARNVPPNFSRSRSLRRPCASVENGSITVASADTGYAIIKHSPAN